MGQDQVIIPAVFMGLLVERLLQRQESANPSGISSRGIYLRTPDDWILFLSFEKFRGPLTINLRGKDATFPIIDHDTAVILNSSKITFPGNGIQINVADAQVWNNPQPSEYISAEITRKRIDSLIIRSLMLTEEDEYRGLLNSVVEGKFIQGSTFPGFEKPLSQLLSNHKPGSLNLDEMILSGFLGLGPGLTPLGDDFVLGAVLAINRWAKTLQIIQGLEIWNTQLLQIARNTTTTLSTNLLVCAIDGLADERLLTVLDSLFAGEESTLADLERLLKWGSSSGLAVLAGMLAVLI